MFNRNFFEDMKSAVEYNPAESPVTSEKLCAFTGHRPSKLGFENERSSECLVLKSALHRAIKAAMEKGYFSFITGMASGVDTWAAEEVLLLKTKYSKIKLYAAIPYEKQYERLYGWQKERYFRILLKCEKVFLISREYHRFCFHKRNSFMIENSRALISVFDGTKGGTANTVALADKKGLDICNILPSGKISSFFRQTKLFE